MQACNFARVYEALLKSVVFQFSQTGTHFYVPQSRMWYNNHMTGGGAKVMTLLLRREWLQA